MAYVSTSSSRMAPARATGVLRRVQIGLLQIRVQFVAKGLVAALFVLGAAAVAAIITGQDVSLALANFMLTWSVDVVDRGLRQLGGVERWGVIG